MATRNAQLMNGQEVTVRGLDGNIKRIETPDAISLAVVEEGIMKVTEYGALCGYVADGDTIKWVR